jgi:hypothetical protein
VQVGNSASDAATLLIDANSLSFSFFAHEKTGIPTNIITIANGFALIEVPLFKSVCQGQCFPLTSICGGTDTAFERTDHHPKA